MMKLCLFDPGIENQEGAPSNNLGDLIIQDAVDRELKRLFGTAEIRRVSTHAPLDSNSRQIIHEADLALVGGTNLLSSRMRRYKQWEISLLDAWRIGRAILLGVGWWQYQDRPDWFTRLVLRMALSKNHLHSVRDEYTFQKLKSIGFENVINTGCPTMWPFAGFDFSRIPSAKSDAALLMLTDYLRNPELDKRLYQIVKSAYRKVYFWPQGRDDLAYARQLGVEAEMLDHSFEALKRLLASDIQFDYIGTRLHGGVYCLLSGRRSLVVEIDNRAREISRDTGFPTAGRDALDAVNRWIVEPASCHVRINQKSIDQWRAQFSTDGITTPSRS